MIVAVTEAAQSASIPRMQRLQTQLAEIALRDPAVAGVVSLRRRRLHQRDARTPAG